MGNNKRCCNFSCNKNFKQIIMLDESVTDFRNLIEEKLKAKQDALGQTEAHLKKFSIIRELNNRGGGRGGGSVRGRLGPPPRNSNSNRQPLGSRLGPRLSNVQDEDDLEMEQVGVMSRVVVEKKSRDDALAEEGQKMDKKEKQRNRRMFGSLLGTLQKFKQDENRVKDRELKKREIEKKIEEKTEKEKEEAKRTKNELFTEKKKQEHEIRILKVQVDRIEQFETWEKNKRREMQYIRTKTEPFIFYMPKEHNEKTMKQYETSTETIEAEINVARSTFEDELLKIEAKLQNPSREDIDAVYEEDDDEEDENKPKSVIVRTISSSVAPAPKRRHESEERPSKESKRSRRQESTASSEGASKDIKVEPKDEDDNDDDQEEGEDRS